MSCESGDITLFILSLFICHEVSHDFVGGVPSLIFNHQPARFGVHRSSGTGNNGVCCVNFNFNFNSNAEVPMSRFTNGPPEMLYKKSCSYKFHNVHRKTSVLEFF